MNCTACGEKVVDGASYCGACGAYMRQPQTGGVGSPTPPANDLPQPMALPDESQPDPEVTSEDPAYAGFWLRGGALLLDSMVLIGLGIGFLVVVTLIDASILVEEDTARADAVELAGGVMSWLYYAVLESSGLQGTIGKRTMGLSVTDLAGQKISFARATGRYFGKVLSALTLGLGYVMAAFTTRKQTLHDLVAGCVVVKAGIMSPSVSVWQREHKEVVPGTRV